MTTASRTTNLRLPLRAALLAGLLLGLASSAAAREETLEWTHPDAANVAGYLVYWGTGPGSYDHVVDTGPLTPQQGVMRFDLTVPEDTKVWVAVKAYDEFEQRSPFSNEQKRVPDLGQPGRPRLVSP